MIPTRKDRVETFSRNGRSITFSFSAVVICGSTREKLQDHDRSSLFAFRRGRKRVTSDGSSTRPFIEGFPAGRTKVTPSDDPTRPFSEDASGGRIRVTTSDGSSRPFTEGVSGGLVIAGVADRRCRARFKY